MAFRKILAYLSLVLGSLCTFIGVAFSAMYVYGAIIDRWGEADQSLLFWHLPLLFIGILCMAIGLFMSFWGIHRIRSGHSS